jgi:polygalacturonase
MNRRLMVKRGAAALVAAGVLGETAWGQGGMAAGSVAGGPVFDPRKYGAKGDGATKDTQAVQAAVDACTQAGGGVVLLNAGTYVCGTIVLKSNVTMQLLAGATILASPEIADFRLPPAGLVATKGQQAAHLIFALNAQNVTLLGPGTIDGNAKVYYEPVQRNVRPEDEYKDVASFNYKRISTISPMVVMANITNLHIEDITLQNAVGWTLHPVGCMKVLIKKVTVRNPVNHSNTDGIDPSSCIDALITDCDVITGDDGIDVYSFNQYGGNQNTRNVTVQNCKVWTPCNALKVGEEAVGSVQNVVFNNCEVYCPPERPVNERPISGICIEMQGRDMAGVSFTNIKMTNARSPIFVRLQKPLGRPNNPLSGSMKNVTIANVQATGATITSSITGLAGLEVQNVSLGNIDIATSEPGNLAWTTGPVKDVEVQAAYGGPVMFGRLPAYGFYVRHVQGLSMNNVRVRSLVNDPRPMLSCDDVQQISLQKVSGTAADPSQPFLALNNTQGVKITGNQAPAGTGVYARITGANTKDVQLQGNDLRGSKSPVQRGVDVPEGGVGAVN